MKKESSSPLTWRVGLFVLTLFVVAGLIGYAEQVAWRQSRFAFEKLRTGNPDRFNLARTLEGKLLEMNESLRQFQSNGSPANRYSFLDDGQEATRLITAHREQLTPPENALLNELAKAFTQYREELAGLLKRRTLSAFAELPGEVEKLIDAQAAPVLGLCRKFEQAQQAAFSEFVSESERRSKELQRLLLAWSLLLPMGGIALLGLVYRRTVGPLRNRLEQSQTTIARQEKLASLGAFAAGVAHEIRNPLMAMKVHLFSLRKHLAPGSPGQEKVAILGNEVNRLEGIVKDFLQFARPAEPLLAKIRIDELLQEITTLLRTKCESNGVQLLMESTGPLTIHADCAQIKQVLLNLVNNAVQSIEGKGTVIVSATESTRTLGGQTGPVVLLEVSDTGKGIPVEMQPRLFDPFFTTKPEGTGLGLSTALRIVEKHHGTIHYRTQPGRGTTFTIVLPQAS